MIWFYDFWYIPFIIPGLLLGFWASYRVKSTFARASKIPSKRGWTGRSIAQSILDANGIHDVSIELVQGRLSDHYDPGHKVLRLSPDVYNGRSLAAAGVAAHEVGHAIQHNRGYAPLAIRNGVVPIANLGSSLSFILVMIGIAIFNPLAILGCALFTMVVVFQVVNLPVEFNASKRARQTLLMNGLITETEDREVGRVLNAAAMTYVAATITAIMTLLYYLMRSGLLGGSSRD